MKLKRLKELHTTLMNASEFRKIRILYCGYNRYDTLKKYVFFMLCRRMGGNTIRKVHPEQFKGMKRLYDL